MDRHRNNLGLLRLFFASLVIIGHAPEQIDGDRRREPLTMMFHTLSSGNLAVDAFFLISGYLITLSWLRSHSLGLYLERRVLRIYPAFIVAYLLSVFALGPLVGAAPWRWLVETAFRLVALQSPKVYPGQLSGLRYPDLNGPMWTIAYEFRCYLLVAALGMTGALGQRKLMLALSAVGVLALIGTTYGAFMAPVNAFGLHAKFAPIIGYPLEDIRFTAIFAVGVCTALFREEISARLDWRAALLGGVGAMALLFHDPHFAEAGLVTLGAAALFWIGLKADLGWLQRINDRNDISYGVYLYGWPIATAIRYFDREVSPLTLAAVTLPLAILAGSASWWGVEKWTKGLAKSPIAR